MEDWKSAFTEKEYDAIVLGTGFKECLLSGILAVEGKSVLHLDRNNYYGGFSASLDINQLYEKLKPGSEPDEAALGNLRDYNTDFIPKFIMAGGMLVKVLIKTGVVNYMEFRPVDGSFVFRKGAVHKVPNTPKDAMGSSLMSTMEKTRAVQFFSWINAYNQDDEKTWSAGIFSRKTLNLATMTGREFFAYWGLESDTIAFVGHALALFQDDSFMDVSASVLVERIKLYKDSLLRFEGMTSPYLYPLYGLGELPQSFARLAAVYGGLYMLNRDIDELVYDDAGVCIGVKAEDTIAKAKVVIGDPSYFPGKTKAAGKVVRAIAIMDHALPDTADCPSCQVIFPASYIQRSNDIYMFCISESHKVAAKGKWVSFASTTVEGDVEGKTAQEIAEEQLSAALPLMQPCTEIFYDMYDVEWPNEDGTQDKCFISKGYDATSHFETAIQDVLQMYARITGKELDLTPPGEAGADGAGAGTAGEEAATES